jgi:hypothetical protein
MKLFSDKPIWKNAIVLLRNKSGISNSSSATEREISKLRQYLSGV